MKRMEGYTISEMAALTGLKYKTVEGRIQRGGYSPLTKDAVYSREVFEAIKVVPGKGRPPKAKQPELKKKAKK
jgi:hypothetical protein